MRGYRDRRTVPLSYPSVICALSFAIIWRWRGSGPDPWVCDGVTCFGIRQSLNNADDDDRKINPSFFPYLRCHDKPIKIQNSSLGTRQSEGCRNYFLMCDFLKLAPMGRFPRVARAPQPGLWDSAPLGYGFLGLWEVFLWGMNSKR